MADNKTMRAWLMDSYDGVPAALKDRMSAMTATGTRASPSI